MKTGKGLVYAFLTTIAISSLSGVDYTIATSGEPVLFLKALLKFDRDAWGSMAFVVIATTMFGGLTSSIAISVAGVILLCSRPRRVPLRLCFASGLLLSIIAAYALSLAHYDHEFLTQDDYQQILKTIVIAGPLSSYVFWHFSKRE